jgi:hypothetical protein
VEHVEPAQAYESRAQDYERKIGDEDLARHPNEPDTSEPMLRAWMLAVNASRGPFSSTTESPKVTKRVVTAPLSSLRWNRRRGIT